MEESDSLEKLVVFVQQAKKDAIVSSSVIKHTEDFIATKFKDHLPRISFYRYMHLWGCQVSATSFVESGNKALEYCGFGPTPKDGIHRSTDKIIAHTDITHRKRQAEAQKNLNQRCLDHSQRHPNKKQKVLVKASPKSNKDRQNRNGDLLRLL